MKTYTIKHVEGKPDWSVVPYLEIDTELAENPLGIRARAQVCYNDEELLVHLLTSEKNYRAEETDPLAEPCRDSCLEFFFCPIESDGRYFNIEFNSIGTMYLGIASRGEDLVRLFVGRSKAEIFTPSISKDGEGWEIFYRVPYSFIRRFFPDFEVHSGKKMRANCYKCAERSLSPHYMSWSWQDGAPLGFHNTACFGEMIFE